MTTEIAARALRSASAMRIMADRKEKKLCLWCGEPAEFRRPHCKIHYEITLATSRNRYRRAHGIPLDAKTWGGRERTVTL